MAGPLSSEEIEDVVSSVRRLVSNEQRPRTLSRDLNSERLLLTPALRVVPETSPLAPLVLDAPLSVAAAETSGVTGQGPDLLAAEVPAPEPTADEAPFSPAEADSLAEALAVDIDPEPLAGEGDLVDAGAVPSVEAEWEDEIWAEPGTVSLGEAALAAEEAEVLTAPALDADAVEVTDPSGTDWSGEGAIPFLPLRRRAEHLAARLAAGAVVDSPQPQDASGGSEEGAPEAAVSDADGPEAGGPEADGLEAVAEAVLSSTSSLNQDAPIPGGEPARVAADLLDADGTPLDVLDEAALHEIVRQTLRSELQGELGERITRNVRKLVRAEINRALLARDLD
jgi:hypothetical protein